MSSISSIQTQQTSQFSSVSADTPLVAFSKECATVYYEMKKIRDSIVSLPTKERQQFARALDKVNFSQMALDQKAGTDKYLKTRPMAKEMTKFLATALADLDRMIYPPKPAPHKNRAVGAFLEGAIGGAIAGGTSSILAEIAPSILSQPHTKSASLSGHKVTNGFSNKTSMTVCEAVVCAWPGLFPFLFGAGEVIVGAALYLKGSSAGRALMMDGWNRMVDGVIENAESNICK